MLQSLVDGNTVLRIISQHFLEQVYSCCGGAFEDGSEILCFSLGQLENEITILLILNLVDQFGTRTAEEFGYHRELFFL